MKKFVCYIITLLIVIGCSKPDKFDTTMYQADSIMEARQNDAKLSLEKLDALRPHLAEMSKAQRMRYHLLQAKAMNKGYEKFTSDSIMKEVTEYYNQNGSDNEKMTANYLLGCVYRDIGDAPTAMRYLEKATDYAQEDIQSYRMLAHIHNQLADLLDRQALVENELQELDVARHYAQLAGDTIDAIATFSLKALAYLLINRTDSAIIVTDSCINMFKELGYDQYAAQLCAYDIKCHIHNKDFTKAHERIKTYETKSGLFIGDEIEEGREVYYYTKGLYYLGVNNTDSAQIMFRRCIRHIDDPNMKVAAYHGMSLLYNKIGISDSTAKYAMIAYEANDSAYQKNVAETMIRQQALYNYSQHQEEALRNAERTARLWRWLLCSFAVLIVIIFSTLFIYKTKKRIMLRRITIMKERYETEKTLLQREMEEMNALLEERQSLLETKEDLIVRREAELNIEIGKREQSIAELQERVAGYERDMNIKDIAILEDELQKAPLKDDFNYYLKNVKEQPTSKDWDKLSRFGKNNFPKLYVTLRNYKVNERELRICLLTRLMFKPKDIAVLVGCRFPEVSLTRSRLLKKIYGIDGKASDFDKRIMLMY